MNLSNFIKLLSFGLFFSFTLSLKADETDETYISKRFTDQEKFELTSIDPKQLGDFDPKENKFWFRDTTNLLEEQHFFSFSELLAKGQTPFQSYSVIKTGAYGKILFIDGESQSAQADEYIYHETLIHPAMIAHPNPKKVLIVGAGEGAAAREVLRHHSVERLVLVDIDGEIIQNCKELLPEWHEGSFTHPKVQLLIEDGKKYVEETNERFDVIVIDVCDKLNDSPAAALYTKEFYHSVKKILNPHGIVVIQAMEFQPFESVDHLLVHKILKTEFSTVASYLVFVPSFWTTWGFVIARDGENFNESVQKIDQTLQERSLDIQLKHYDGITHQNMFSLPKEIRKLL